jgi:uncharacterized protein (TIRG00374 family)
MPVPTTTNKGSSRWRTIALLVTKIAVTFSLIYWLLSGVRSQDILRTVTLIEPAPFVAAILLHAAAFVAGGLRWWLLLRHAYARTRFRSVFPSYYLGVFSNIFLPSGVGGDFVRTIHLNIRGLSAKALVGSALIDRTIGLLVVLVMGSTSLALSPDIVLDYRSKLALLGFVSAVSVAVVLLMWPPFNAAVERLAKRYRNTRRRRALLEIISLCHSYRTRVHLLLAAVALTVAMQTLVILTYYLLGRGIGVNLSPITYFGIIPLVFLAANLPISIGGLGVRESTLVGLLVAARVEFHLAVTLSLVYLLVLWLASAPGAAVLLLNIRKPAPMSP